MAPIYINLAHRWKYSDKAINIFDPRPINYGREVMRRAFHPLLSLLPESLG
jgi:hypothetical protein